MRRTGARIGVQLVLAGCFFTGLAACGSAIPSDWKAPDGLGHADTYLEMRIVGLGAVTFQPTAQPCISMDDEVYQCEPRLWHGASVVIRASTDPGWTFVHWFIPPSEQPHAPVDISPAMATAIVLPVGTQAEIGAQFTREALPLQATKDETTGATTYRTTLTNPRHAELSVKWTGPSCGEWGPQGEAVTYKSSQSLKMTWTRPADCDASGTDVVLTVTGWESGGTVVCTFPGAESGTGGECLEDVSSL